ncbi:MAG: hypothetical protein A2898_04260 [Candidatus Kerfeldbacteria bacterium RIFCSPLOWO2_01_FULL_48_11]|uniref:Proline--tRNA ligase n=1 Tax=Candidatus Kerfeldbacteria bacterium RIFCSPLOWO2_01_FULL_48_11 TaxID=1798543 RepID=A0A1G2B3J6_9BACT|nr:MAG: Prolyl-tRNA synthetase [Parcubacteria group bacterium GW2011_GWA2_48_9]KKW16223.1 MAG: Prolyl-tRNA synthetase [Parcubacteria group bacterium GW2011_GWC2_49_9]OGY82780.1 MAG: hypothetical protein A2898_04260 [Candidatus Kerfeldbacteria bacterium RIFCSPLOWO2_01_FULL_48_11]
MKLSALFTKTKHNPPQGEVSINAKLLEQAGYISKMMAGVYAYMPLGLRVLKKVSAIIREEMDALGAQEIYLSALQPKALWEVTGRWNELSEIMYQFTDRSDQEVGLATTHEEPITEIAKHYISSYKDLPLAVYQIQDKFRDEPRAKSGLIRGREFSMKDLYSFHTTGNDLDSFYLLVANAYKKIFQRLCLPVRMIEASGGTFTKSYSHEFQVIADAGEDKLIYCTNCDYAQNAEISRYKDGGHCPHCEKTLTESRGIEVGNIFKLGTKFSDALGLHYTDSDGVARPVHMASYGIGPGRVMGTIVEVSHDERGIIWPKSVTPFHAYIASLGNDPGMIECIKKVYTKSQSAGYEVLYDDRNVSPGVKLRDADLLGIPLRIVTGTKSEGKYEISERSMSTKKIVTEKEVFTTLSSFYS